MLAFLKLMMRVEWSLGVQTTLWILPSTGTYEEYRNSPCLSLRWCVAAPQFARCTTVKSMNVQLAVLLALVFVPLVWRAGRWSHINPVWIFALASESSQRGRFRSRFPTRVKCLAAVYLLCRPDFFSAMPLRQAVRDTQPQGQRAIIGNTGDAELTAPGWSTAPAGCALVGRWSTTYCGVYRRACGRRRFRSGCRYQRFI